jgi:branched-chain amino acid transport system substrate-binding protein
MLGRRLSSLTLMIMLIALALYPGCHKPSDQVIRVGAILPLTGRLSVMGQVEQNAMSLALEKANAGGKKLEILFEDSKGTPSDAVSAARKLLDVNQVDILLTSTTGASLAVEPIATERKKNLIAFCMDPDVATKSDYVIRYYEGVEEESSAITKYFAEETAPKRVGIMYGKIAAWEKVVNNILLPFFKARNISVPYTESYPINTQDFDALVIKMKESKIDHLILLGYGFEYPSIFKPLAQYELLGHLQIIGGWGFLYTDVDSKLLEGILVSGPEFIFRNQESASQFQNAYNSRYGHYPNFDAAYAYNVIESLAQTVKKDELNKPIKDLFVGHTFNGVVGQYTFTPDGNMVVRTTLGRYQNGRIVELENQAKSKAAGQ